VRDKIIFVKENFPATFTDHAKVRDMILELVTQTKTAAKASENNAVAVLQREIDTHNATKPANENSKEFRDWRAAMHAILFQYEKQHLSGSVDWNTLKSQILGLKTMLTPNGDITIHDKGSDTKDSCGFIMGQAGTTRIALGTLYRDNARFELINPQPTSVNGKLENKVWQLVEGSKNYHYIYLANSNTFVRRFVTRGLNAVDCYNLARKWNMKSAHPSLKKVNRNFGGVTFQAAKQEARSNSGKPKMARRHDLTEKQEISERQQLISHTRGWYKRYISTGMSNRPIYSTRGAQFQSMYGAAIIDLALVPSASIFDLHSPAAVEAWFKGLKPEDIVSETDSHFDAATYNDEEFLAMRDVLRTREVLVKEEIPYAAVRFGAGVEKIVGIGFTERRMQVEFLAKKQVSLILPTIAEQDDQEFPSIEVKYWSFLRFNDAGAADDAWKALKVASNDAPGGGYKSIKINVYQFPAKKPAGMG
jgi:hypothetical protein